MARSQTKGQKLVQGKWTPVLTHKNMLPKGILIELESELVKTASTIEATDLGETSLLVPHYIMM